MNSGKRVLIWGLYSKQTDCYMCHVLSFTVKNCIVVTDQSECTIYDVTCMYFLSTALHHSVLHLPPLFPHGKKECHEVIHRVKDMLTLFPSFPKEGSLWAALFWKMGQETISLGTGHLLVYLHKFWCQKERHTQKTSADCSLCPGSIPIEVESLNTVLFWRLTFLCVQDAGTMAREENFGN